MLPDHLSVLYRGPLDSCNYGCTYCPFAKRVQTPEQKDADTRALARFTGWVEQAPLPVSVLFTPWGEALHHTRYRDAIVALSRLPHVRRVAAQTNLAGHPGWLADADRDTVALWTTYHPSQTTREKFLRRCAQLDELGVRYSVGIVGAPWLVAEAEALRAELPAAVPLWVNAWSRDGGPVRPGTYDAELTARFTAVDPLFEVGMWRLRTGGLSCNAGHTAISVDGDGTVRRCHLTSQVLGNLYQDPLPALLTPRRCPRASCPCHIGYVHLPALGADAVYGDGLLERIPDGPQWADPAAYLARARTLASLSQGSAYSEATTLHTPGRKGDADPTRGDRVQEPPRRGT